SVYFFFFQAEDGIRVFHVTGVQTCALPISFRAGMAALFSLLITIAFGKSLIEILRRKQVGESIRDLGLEGQMEKKGTPTMGGIRSEERRVGKEGRVRRATEQKEKNKTRK